MFVSPIYDQLDKTRENQTANETQNYQKEHLFVNEFPLMIRYSKRKNHSISGDYEHGSLFNAKENGSS